jgi:preprotein translocase subunit SecG
MHQLVLIVHVLVSAAVIGLVLVQHGKGADTGAAFGGGSSSVFGSRGPTTLLTRLTAIFVTLFFLTSMSLAFLSKQQIDRRSVIERVQTEQIDTGVVPGVSTEGLGTGDGGLQAPTVPDN